MKNNIKIIYALLFTVVFTVSCDDLERFPANQIDRANAFQSIQDVEAWNIGLYSNLRSNVYGSRLFTTDVQADQLNATLTYGNRNGAPHRWTEFLANTGVLNSVWNGYYNAISNLNVVITGFPTVETDVASERATIKQYLGNAHLARAYYYHNLVVRFGKMYDPATASSDLGVPILTEFDINAQKPRSTVQEVYDLIESDIAIAKTNLASVPGASGSQTFTKDVVTALEARVKFYKREYAQAKVLADQLINSGKYPLYETLAGLQSMWYRDAQQEVIMSLTTIAPNELANTNAIYLGFIPATGNWRPDFLPSQWVVDMYDDADFRKQVYLDKKTVEQENIEYPNIWVVNKYPGNPALFTGANTNYQHTPIMFRIGEMYTISAESALSVPGSDPLLPLNQLRAARNLPALAGLAGDALTDAVRAERTKELAFEGFRLDDLRRWNLGFTRRDPQNLTLINVGADFNTLSQPAGADKFTWGIPTNEITINQAMEGQQNPGW